MIKNTSEKSYSKKVLDVARSEVPYARYSMRGMVEGPIKHKAKPSVLLVSRPYSSAVSRGTV